MNHRTFLQITLRIASMFFFLSIVSCDLGQGTFAGVFTISKFSSNKLNASQNEILTLTWEYEQEDLLTGQRLLFHRLYLGGITSELVDLEVNQRSFEFTFIGPVTVELQAQTARYNDTTFRPHISAALQIKKLQDLYFTATFRSGSDTPLYPYLGYPQRSVFDNQNHFLGYEFINRNEVEFTDFVGFYDANTNGMIDPLTTIFDSTQAFRGLSINGIEYQSFGFREGSLFPYQLFSTPEIGRTNAIIFAGAIIMNGEEVPYKAEDGDGTFRRTPSDAQGVDVSPLGFDPIYIAIPLLVSNGQIVIADIQIGNLNQKLVTTVYTNPLLLFQTTPGQINVLTVDSNSSFSKGDIKGAISGLTVTRQWPADNTPFDAMVSAESIQWQTEFISDERLFDVISHP